jgi:hypothetical protein
VILHEDHLVPSPYGAGAPTYESASVQQSAIDGRLKVAIGIRDSYAPDGLQPDPRRHVKWSHIVDELLDRRAETMGRTP